MSIKSGIGLGLNALQTIGGLFGGGESSGSQTFTNSAPAFNMMQGMQAKTLDMQQQMYNEQANIALGEAQDQAMQVAQQARTFREGQALAYSGSGILLEGTPMKVLNHTRKLAAQEVAAIQRRGAAQANLFRMQGMIGKNEGQAQLLGQSMSFAAQQAQAQMAASAGSNRNWMQTIGQLGGLFGQAAKSNTGMLGYGSGIANAPTSPDPFDIINGGMGGI